MRSINSWVCAIRGRTCGITRLDTATTPANKPIHSKIIPVHPPPQSPPDHRKATSIKSSIATISCTIKTPIDILPYKLSESCVSFNNFTITIVLEKLIAAAISKELCQENHNHRSNTNPNNVHNHI